MAAPRPSTSDRRTALGDAPAPPARLHAGLVAFNEEATIERSLRSLTDQELPPGATWGTIWVVASGCTDRTVAIVEALAAADRRVELIVEPERRGKAAALAEILRRADGAPLVLLNSDARAEPGAVAALLASARDAEGAYAIMARPVLSAREYGVTGRLVRLLWALHHEAQIATVGGGRGNNLTDELLLVRLPGLTSFPEGLINDGSYVGAWVRRQGGSNRYATEARVAIELPGSLAELVRQRRRILAGHAQIRGLVGQRATTLQGLAFRDPKLVLNAIRATVRGDPRRAAGLAMLLLPEAAARSLWIWDRLPPRRDHRRWEIVRSSVAWPEPEPGASPGAHPRP